jgi:transcription elongation factor Elf1
MADRSLRGIRLGAQSLQSEEGVVFHERAQHIYNCTSCGRDTTMTFAVDAEVPEAWECRTCGAEALLRIGDGTATVDHSDDKVARTHWDMLLERRSIPELEELLEERLAYVRARRGAGQDESASKLSA